jgi:hypothetical protein
MKKRPKWDDTQYQAVKSRAGDLTKIQRAKRRVKKGKELSFEDKFDELFSRSEFFTA